MATLNTLYDIETAINNGAYTLLSGSGFYPTLPRDTSVNTTPSIKAKFVLGNPTGHLNIISGSWVQDTFNGEMTVTVETAREINNVSHSVYVSNVRRIFSDNRTWNTASVLVNHQVVDITSNGVTSTVREEESIDSSELRFPMIVSIKT